MSNIIPGFVSSGISAQYQYLKNFKSAQSSGQEFDYRTGGMIASAPPQNSSVPFDNNYLQGYISQQVPQFGFNNNAGGGYQGGFQLPIQQIGNPFHQQFFSQEVFLQYDIMNKLAMLNRLMNPAGYSDNGNNDLAQASRRRGISAGQAPLLRGNDALDLLLDKQKVDSSETEVNADGDRYHFSDADLQAFKDGIARGDFSEKELGQAIMAKMGRISSDALDEYQGLITQLVTDGTLQPRSLFNPFLKAMKPERQTMALKGLADAGITHNGQADTNFGGLILQHLNNDEKPDLQELLRDMLFRYHENAVQNPETGEAQRVFSLLRFIGFNLNINGTLDENEPQPFELKARVNIS